MNRRTAKPAQSDDVPFPVTPFLDMAFQLLAFFILTFQPPSQETRLDLYLPSAPAALPNLPAAKAGTIAPPEDDDLETDLLVKAESNANGDLTSLRLGDSPVESPEDLGERLRKYAKILQGRPLRIRLRADDRLKYEKAARLIGACESAGASSIRLEEGAP